MGTTTRHVHGFGCAIALVAPVWVHAGDDGCYRYVVDEIIEAPACGPTVWSLHAWSMNDQRYIVGSADCGLAQAMVWYGGGEIQFVPMPPGTSQSDAYDINEQGHIVGRVEIGGPSRGFFFDGETTTVLHPPSPDDGAYCQARGINDQDQVVGFWGDATGVRHACLWEDGVLTDLSPLLPGPKSYAWDINNAGTITGWAGENGVVHTAFSLNGEDVVVYDTIPGGDSSEGWRINEAGTVLAGRGRVQTDPARYEAFAVIDGVETRLGTLKGFERSYASDVLEDGLIVGNCTGPSGARGCLWIDGELACIRDLLLPPVTNSFSEVACGNALGDLVVRHAPDLWVLRRVRNVPGDVDGSCRVDFADLIVVLRSWERGALTGDANGDGQVGIDDLLFVLERWEG